MQKHKVVNQNFFEKNQFIELAGALQTGNCKSISLIQANSSYNKSVSILRQGIINYQVASLTLQGHIESLAIIFGRKR